jgi:ATP-dependent Clp protease ATP-binding subunit ClpC
MTSNVGARNISGQSRAMGFGSGTPDARNTYEVMKENVTRELKQVFRPEFINRIDEIIVFHALDQAHTRKIVDLMLGQVAKRLAERDVHISATEAAKDYLAKAGFDPEYGARPLRRAIQRLVEDSLSEELLGGKIAIGDHVLLDAKDDKIVFTKITQETPEPEESPQK